MDLQRELRRGRPGDATALLERLADEEVGIAFVTWMEFAEGFEDDGREICGRFLGHFPVLWPDVDVCWEASRIARSLAADGRSIGDHDVWIAALCIRHQRPVVTRNNQHFERVQRLEVKTY